MKAFDESRYEVVIGLEVHAQLMTRSKLFCGDPIAYGAEPNTQVSPITLGHPGVLPKMNKKAIELAVRMGLACHCEIVRNNYFARKNYFYPDLPKGYQLSQHTTPICSGGYVNIDTGKGERSIQLNRIHLEEDAGKSLHDIYPDASCIDLNRAGTPLIEIVSEPDLFSADEAFAYLTEIRKIVRYTEVCDGNMEEGSLRCDANISVRKKGETKLGTKVEIKNLNSIRNVKRAIEYEAQRIAGLLDNNEPIIQQTRSFDADNGTTFAIRDKEEADDYRYFADPDLAPFALSEEFIESIRATLPPLPEARIKKYTNEFQLSDYDARVISEDKYFADYFEQLAQHTTHYKAAANWMQGPVRSWLNENRVGVEQFPLKPVKLAALIALVDSNTVSFSAASGRIFSRLLESPDEEPSALAASMNLIQETNVDTLDSLVQSVLDKMPEKVQEFKKGKKGLIKLFVGEVMKQSKGKADPQLTNRLLTEKLKN